MAASLYDMFPERLGGGAIPAEDLRGKVLLVVNVASECGFTPQYKGLQALYERFRDQGLVVVGSPCNQFGGQEPGDAGEIAQFCERNFGVTFPLTAKVDVNGRDAHPLWAHLREEQPGLLGSTAIKWNFTKFLVNRKGEVVKRYAPTDKPEDLASDITRCLAEPA